MLKEFKPNYSISTGNYTSENFQVDKKTAVVLVVTSGILVSDVTIEIEQSIDTVSWGQIPESVKSLAVGQTSHQWNLAYLTPGMFLRVVLKKGTATSGTLQTIKYLTE
jgi:hypothetical protein